MMIHRSNRPLTRASHTTRPIHSDSDVVVLALVTAAALEAQGEIREAAQWLRRAADQARKDGREERVCELTQAAVELAKMNRTALLPGSSSSSSRRTTRTSFRRTTSPRADRRAERATMEALLGLMASAG